MRLRRRLNYLEKRLHAKYNENMETFYIPIHEIDGDYTSKVLLDENGNERLEATTDIEKVRKYTAYQMRLNM